MNRTFFIITLVVWSFLLFVGGYNLVSALPLVTPVQSQNTQIKTNASLDQVHGARLVKRYRHRLIISWRRVTGATSYRLAVLDSQSHKIKQVTTQHTKKTIRDLEPDTTYQIRICALANSVRGTFSKKLTAKTKPEPSKTPPNEESDEENEAESVPQTFEVSISDFAFDPSELTIIAGDTVRWMNNDSVSHTVTQTNGQFNSGTLTSVESYEFIFTESGVYPYYCAFHPSMAGIITVE